MLPSSISVLKESNMLSWSKFSKSSTQSGAVKKREKKKIKSFKPNVCRRTWMNNGGNLWTLRTKRRYLRLVEETSDENLGRPTGFGRPFEGRSIETNAMRFHPADDHLEWMQRHRFCWWIPFEKFFCCRLFSWFAVLPQSDSTFSERAAEKHREKWQRNTTQHFVEKKEAPKWMVGPEPLGQAHACRNNNQYYSR